MPALSVEQSSPGGARPNLIFIGPPGSGKGSLADKFCSLNIEHVSSGDFFRAEVTRGTSLGASFSTSLEKGEFISDDSTLAVMKKWFFARRRSKGFLLDGFPRNRLQAAALDEWLETRRETITACMQLKLSRKESISRISQRRVCPEDGLVYHLTFHPPLEKDRCDRCGGLLIQRSDDTEETVIHRLGLYEEHTLPLADYYREQGLLYSFDASIPKDAIYQEILSTLASLGVMT